VAEAEGDTEKAEDVGLELEELELRAKELDSRRTSTISAIRYVPHTHTHTPKLDFTEARDSQWQWHQLGHMQVCISLQTDNHASTPPLSFYRPDALPAKTQFQSLRDEVMKNILYQQNGKIANNLILGVRALKVPTGDRRLSGIPSQVAGCSHVLLGAGWWLGGVVCGV